MVPGFDLTNWFAFFAPPQTSKPIVDRLYQSILKALGNPPIKDRLAQEGYEIKGLAPDKFDKTFRDEIAYWQKFVKDTNLKVE